MCIKILYNNKTLFLPNISFCPPDVNLRTGTGKRTGTSSLPGPPRKSPLKVPDKRYELNGEAPEIHPCRWPIRGCRQSRGMDTSNRWFFRPLDWRESRTGWRLSFPSWPQNCPCGPQTFSKHVETLY